MVNQSPEQENVSPLMGESTPQGTQKAHAPQAKADPPWIIQRTKKKGPEVMDADRNIDQAPPVTPNDPPRLPDNLIHTPTPIGGFPTIHLLTPPWFNLLPEQKSNFDTYPNPKVWIRDWQASKEADLMQASDNL